MNVKLTEKFQKEKSLNSVRNMNEKKDQTICLMDCSADCLVDQVIDMSNIVHNFKKSINTGYCGEQIIKSYFETNPNIADVIDVSKDKAYQNKDIDFIVKFKNGDSVSVELKTDTYDTGNIFYEAISNQEYNVLGCMAKSKAKCLLYYFIKTKELYVIDFKAYKKWVNDNNERFAKKKIKNVNRYGNDITHSVGFLIPKKVFEKEMIGHFNKKIIE